MTGLIDLFFNISSKLDPEATLCKLSLKVLTNSICISGEFTSHCETPLTSHFAVHIVVDGSTNKSNLFDGKTYLVNQHVFDRHLKYV